MSPSNWGRKILIAESSTLRTSPAKANVPYSPTKTKFAGATRVPFGYEGLSGGFYGGAEGIEDGLDAAANVGEAAGVGDGHDFGLIVGERVAGAD
jgi:hypothetical protein